MSRIAVNEREVQIVHPARPDDFLDDPAVIAANRRDDYMPYWSYLWPAAVSMADALARADWPPDAQVLELGCGVGLVGLAALLQGWRVTFSDHDSTAVQCALLNARLNGVEDGATPLVMDWRQPQFRRWPVIVGCDLVYEARNHPVLLDLLEKSLAADGVCWFGDPGRSPTPRFVDLAVSRGFRVDVRDAAGVSRGIRTAQAFQIIELRSPRQ